MKLAAVSCAWVYRMTGLVKAKDYDWKDSNMALFGSSTDREVKSKLVSIQLPTNFRFLCNFQRSLLWRKSVGNLSARLPLPFSWCGAWRWFDELIFLNPFLSSSCSWCGYSISIGVIHWRFNIFVLRHFLNEEDAQFCYGTKNALI